MRLGVSGAQPLFTLGLLMFASSLVDFLSLLFNPSIDINIIYFCQKYHLKDTYKIFKKFHVGLKFEWDLSDQYWLSWERPPFEVFFGCLCDGLLGVTYANMLVTIQWPLNRAAHLTSLVWVCGMAAWKLNGTICAMNENRPISTKVSLEFFPKGPKDNISALINGLAPTRRQAIFWTNDG